MKKKTNNLKKNTSLKTLRDELAIGSLCMMQYSLDLRYIDDDYGVTTIKALAKAAYRVADEMLLERER